MLVFLVYSKGRFELAGAGSRRQLLRSFGGPSRFFLLLLALKDLCYSSIISLSLKQQATGGLLVKRRGLLPYLFQTAISLGLCAPQLILDVSFSVAAFQNLFQERPGLKLNA